MSYPYRRQRRARTWDERDWAGWHARKRAAVSSKFFGLDAEVTHLFYHGLSRLELLRVFNIYGARWGEPARRYAERTYPKWRAGAVTPSAETLIRLLQCVPPVLSLPEKAALIAHLRRRSRRVETAHLRCTLAEVDSRVPAELTRLFASGLKHTIPEHVRGALNWLSATSAKATEQILKAGEAVEAQWLAAAADAEVRRLKAAAQRALSIEGSLKRSFEHVVSTP